MDEDDAQEDMDLNRSLFDSHKAESLDEALEYMVKTYGFFIPDVEFVADLEGLMDYLHAKVHPPFFRYPI